MWVGNINYIICFCWSVDELFVYVHDLLYDSFLSVDQKHQFFHLHVLFKDLIGILVEKHLAKWCEVCLVP